MLNVTPICHGERGFPIDNGLDALGYLPLFRVHDWQMATQQLYLGLSQVWYVYIEIYKRILIFIFISKYIHIYIHLYVYVNMFIYVHGLYRFGISRLAYWCSCV